MTEQQVLQWIATEEIRLYLIELTGEWDVKMYKE